MRTLPNSLQTFDACRRAADTTSQGDMHGWWHGQCADIAEQIAAMYRSNRDPIAAAAWTRTAEEHRAAAESHQT